MLKVENLTVRYGGLVAVDSIDFALNERKLTSIIGPNGAGKSTLLKAITGELVPTTGRVYFEGKDITNIPDYERVKMGMALSFQICRIFPKMTVLENMLVSSQRHNTNGIRDFFFSLSKTRRFMKSAEKILDYVDLLDVKDNIAGDLPQGEKKRLEVGMALAIKPRILFLDEPTAGSTNKEVHQIISLLNELKKRLTITLVEHKMNVVMNLSDRIIVMHKGRIIADDHPKNVKRDELVRDVYLGELYA